jgi:hypothetical protein
LFFVFFNQQHTKLSHTYQPKTKNTNERGNRKNNTLLLFPFFIFIFILKKINKTKTKNHRAVLSYDHFYDGDRISPITLPTFSSGDSDPPESEENPL